MLVRFWRRIRRGNSGRPAPVFRLGELENLASADAMTLLLVQERARLDYLAAKEALVAGRWWTLGNLLERLLRLESVNAVVQSILNERALERLIELDDDNVDVDAVGGSSGVRGQSKPR